tara:strand:- start:581 stop:1360 length:780 start_codon:yes stop_codon:yes gene_type:complete
MRTETNHTKQLSNFIDRMADDMSVLKLLIGDSRKQQTEAIYIIEGTEPEIKIGDLVPQLLTREEAADIILEDATELGWGSDYTHMRLNVKDGAMRHLKSITLRRQLEDGQNGTGGDIAQSFGHVTDALLQMAKELQRTVATTTGALAHERELNREMMEYMIEARRDTVEAEAQAMALDIALNQDNKGESFQSEALGRLESIIKAVAGARQELTPEEAVGTVEKWIHERPEIIDMAVQNETIANGILSRIMGNPQNNDTT